MKKIIFIIIGLVILSGVRAQSRTPDDLDIIQSIFGKEKRQLVEIYMDFPGDSVASLFWPVYEEYESKRRELVRERLYTLSQYADKYTQMDAQTAENLSKDAFKNEKNIIDLHKKYFGKIKKAAGALNASKFMQMESYIQKTIELSIMEDIPFVGEMKK